MLGPIIMALKNAQVHFRQFPFVIGHHRWRVQVWRHSHLSALVLSLIPVHDLAFVGTLDKNVHLLASKEIHDFEI